MSRGTVSLYSSGSLLQEPAVTNIPTSLTSPSFILGNSNGANGLKGRIYSFSAFDRPLSPSEIAQETLAFQMPEPSLFFALNGSRSFPAPSRVSPSPLVFTGDYLLVNGSGGAFDPTSQWLDFGRQRMDVSSMGFSMTVTFEFHGTAGSWERFCEFGSGLLLDNLLTGRAIARKQLAFSLINNGGLSEYFTRALFEQNFQYNVAMIYEPSIGQYGVMKVYIDTLLVDQWVISQPQNSRNVTFSYVARSLWAGDSAARIKIYRLKTYNGAISDSQISRDFDQSIDLLASPPLPVSQPSASSTTYYATSTNMQLSAVASSPVDLVTEAPFSSDSDTEMSSFTTTSSSESSSSTYTPSETDTFSSFLSGQNSIYLIIILAMWALALVTIQVHQLMKRPLGQEKMLTTTTEGQPSSTSDTEFQTRNDSTPTSVGTNMMTLVGTQIGKFISLTFDLRSFNTCILAMLSDRL